MTLYGYRALPILSPITANSSAAATSGWIPVRGFEGLCAVGIDSGTVGANTTLTITFQTARDAAGSGAVAIEPISGPPPVVDQSNDPYSHRALFDAAQLLGYLKVIGTLTGGNVNVAYMFLGLPKYATSLGVGPTEYPAQLPALIRPLEEPEMLNSVCSALRATSMLAPVSAANTAAATSGWIDVRGYEGPIALITQTGNVGAASTITYTFNHATSGAGANSAPVVPLNGALAVVDPNNDPMTQVASFDPATLGGWLQVVGTITGAGPVLVGYSIVGIPKYTN